MKTTGIVTILCALGHLACSSAKPAIVTTSADGGGGHNAETEAGSPDLPSDGQASGPPLGGFGGGTGAEAGTATNPGGGAPGGGGVSGGGGGTGATDASTSPDAPSGSDAIPSASDAAAREVAASIVEGGTEDAASAGDAGAWPAVTDFSAPGPFPPMRQINVGPGGAYDIFRPTDLADHRKHPIISWANGTLFSVDDYQMLLSHWASHGFVVIANHTNTTAGGATHKAGIDWLVAQNATPTGPYFGALDPKQIGAAGHSQGGGATIAAGSNKPGITGITATLPLMPLLSFEADKTIVAHQLVPMFNINASMDNRDPTGAIANQIYEGAVTELVQAAFIGVHEDAMNAKMHGPTVAWWRWKLMGDLQAKAVFYPASGCGLCKDADWKLVRTKNPAP